MPNLKDAPVLVVGQVIDVAPKTNRETLVLEGHKVTVMAGDGFAVINVDLDDIQPKGFLPMPEAYQQVAWMVRNRPWSVGDGSGMSTRYVRNVNAGDLQNAAKVAGLELVGSK